ncbi:hypothetical protein HB943_14705 [Listeria weihenstephanensis]|uniref:LXG domain-containing protein n=1 Tax=Listeria weihenstephanensis TaxID=1006155 RepID=A0A841ZAF5_9LIST|nr:T7SS effector LXG polymorphic toxin [Listeria weihenstephanensis]MBC1501849.1 hypothetical protein [Listeria weihenstephanensis]
MRIQVSEMNLILERQIVLLSEENHQINEAMTAVDIFVTKTETSFIGETGDASRAYLQEVYKPIQSKTLEINEKFSELLKTYNEDALAQYGALGIVHEEYLENDYVKSVNKVTDFELEAYRDFNKLASEANEYFPVGQINTNETEQYRYDLNRQVQINIEQLHAFDEKWRAKFKEVEQLQDALDKMIAQVTNTRVSASQYKAGMIQFVKTPDEIYAEWLKVSKDLTGQDLYRAAIEFGKKYDLVIEKDIDGMKAYEFKGWFIFENYETPTAGHVVLLELDGQLQIFIYRQGSDGENTVSVPMGEFTNPFDVFFNMDRQNMVAEAMKIEDQEERVKAIENIYEKEKLPSFTPSTEIIDHYSKYNNAVSFGDGILKYLGNMENGQSTFTPDELDAIAGQWSGTDRSYKFGGEIASHAFAFNIGMSTPFASEDFANRTAIADLGNSDNDLTKTGMDVLSYAREIMGDIANGNMFDSGGYLDDFKDNFSQMIEDAPKALEEIYRLIESLKEKVVG